MTARTVAGLGEDQLVGRVMAAIGSQHGDVLIGPGDDAAVVDAGSGALVLTVDSQRERVHFERGWLTAAELGRRAVSVAVSDLAAMGARPRWLLCALALPGDTEVTWVDDLAGGLADAAAGYGAVIVGGDVSRTPADLAVEVTAMGAIDAPARALRRSAAVAGDICWVTGAPGLAGAGLYLLRHDLALDQAASAAALTAYRAPVARIRLGIELAGTFARCAAMDLSDGIATDARRICAASGVSLEIDEPTLSGPPLSDLEGLIPRAWSLALAGGEDYELLIGLPESDSGALTELCARLEVPLRRIGRFGAGEPVVRVRAADGSAYDAAAHGWDPFSEAD